MISGSRHAIFAPLPLRVSALCSFLLHGDKIDLMAEIGDITLFAIALVSMVGVLIVSIIPFVPGPLLMWVVALGYGLLTDFDRLHPVAFGIICVLMVFGSTTDYWMPVLGMRARGASCWGGIGTIIGAFVGTFFIPIPIPFCGTLIGAVIGALTFEFIHIGDAREAMRVGGLAVKFYIYGLIVEFCMSLTILGVFVASVHLTG